MSAVTITRLTPDPPSLSFTMMDIKLSPYVPVFQTTAHEILHLTSNQRRLTTSSSLTPPVACVLTNCDAFIPSSIPLEQPLALTEQSVMAMFIVHVLNRQRMAWAAVSGAKFVPLCSFRGYLWLAPCSLVCASCWQRVSVCHRLLNPASCMQLGCKMLGTCMLRCEASGSDDVLR